MRHIAYLFYPLFYPLLRQESLLSGILFVFLQLKFSNYPVLGLSVPSHLHSRVLTRIPVSDLPHRAVLVTMENTFGITEETGDVYRRDPHDWVLLGTLPYVLNDPSPIGRAVQNWWKSLVESDEPLPLLILSSKLRGPRIPSSEAMIINGLEVGVAVARE